MSTEQKPPFRSLGACSRPIALARYIGGGRAHWSPALGRHLGLATTAKFGFLTRFFSLFNSEAKSPSLIPNLLPFQSVTGYKWKQQGHSRLYFQFSLKVIQTERLNSRHGCPSKARRTKLPFVFTTAVTEPLTCSLNTHLWPQQR